MAAPAAPAGGAFAGLTAGLVLVCFALVVLYGLQYGYSWTLGAFVRTLSGMVEDIWVVGGTLSRALDSMDSFVMKIIGRGIESLEHVAGKLWYGLERLAEVTADTVADLADATLSAFNGLIYGEIPEQIRDRTRDYTNGLAGLRSGTEQRQRAEAQTRSKGIDQLRRDLAAESLARQRGIDRLRARITDVVMPGIRAVDSAVDDLADFARRNLAHRLSTLEQALAAGAVGAVAVAAITRLFPYWQCTNVRRFNRLLCRSPIGALDDLFGLALTLVGPISIVEFAVLLQESTDFITGAVTDWIVED